LLNDIAEKVTKSTGITCYVRSILNVLEALTKTNNIWELVAISHEPFICVIEILKELEKRKLVSITNVISLTNRGREILSTYMYCKKDYRCDKCSGRGILFNLLPEDVIKEYMKIVMNRPRPIQEFDQGFVTEDTALSRIAIMDQYGDVRGRDIFIIGDDDLISVALGLTNWPKKIVVLEIDERLVSYISKISNEYGLNIEILKRDASEPLPNYLVSKFDTFFTDPPEPLEAIKLFVGRGIMALRKEKSAGYISLTLIDSSIDKWREIQKMFLTQFNVVITDIIRDFNRYQNWDYITDMKIWKLLPVKQKPESIWYTSSLFRIEVLKNSKGFNERMKQDIYSDRENISR